MRIVVEDVQSGAGGSTTMEVWIGIDVGTQGVRAEALSRDGVCRGEGSEDLDTSLGPDGSAVQAAEAVWAAVVRATQSAVRGLPPSARVRGLGLDATCSLLLTDAALRPLTPVWLWMDVRAAAAAKVLSDVFGGAESAELPWAKASRLAAEAPREAMYLVEVGDWLLARFTGRLTRSRASATIKWHADARGNLPVSAVEQALGVHVGRLLPTEVAGPTECVGALTREASTLLGLPAEVSVSGHLIDAYAAAVGAAATHAGCMAVIMGSSTCELMHGEPGEWTTVAPGGFWGPFEGVYGTPVSVLEAGQVSTGSVVRWIKRLVGARDYADLDRTAAEVGPGAAGAQVFPAWQGVRSPRFDARARGQIRGLALGHDVGHLVRAVYEATAFDMRRILEATGRGHQLDQVVACGGGRRSRVWMQIVAGVLNRPITLAPVASTARGSAVLAMVATGALSRVTDWPAQGIAVAPDPVLVRAYDELYPAWIREFQL